MQGFIKNWKISLIYTLLPVLLYGILGPLEIYAGNADEMVFILKDFFVFFFIVSIILWLTGSAVLALLPDKVRNVLQVAIFIFSVLSYIQNLFLNSKLMNLDGNVMDWENMRGVMFFNLIVWLIFICVFSAVPLIWKKVYQKIYMGITAFISAVQLVMIVSLFIVTLPIGYRGGTMIVSPEGQLEAAAGNNVIVLLFDSVDNIQFEETMAEHPEIAEALKDFTYYDNADSHYCYTSPSIAHMLTGVEVNCNVSPVEYKESCWHEERSVKFFDTL